MATRLAPGNRGKLRLRISGSEGGLAIPRTPNA